MRLQKGILLIGLFFLLNLVMYAQTTDNIASINKALKAADAGSLASFFNTTIDLEIDGTDGNYSKKQAELILHDFFKKSAIKSYTPNHQGESNDGSKYIIGTYITNNDKVYRVYVLLKKNSGNLLINQLQFEAE